MLVRTGFKAALAAETVSAWICNKVALLDFRSVWTGLPKAEGGGGGGIAPDEDVDDCEPDAEVGSAVIRSISVVPAESCYKKNNKSEKKIQEDQKPPGENTKNGMA